MKIRQFQVDAFACRRFEGNPAAVCPLDSWLDDGLMQAIAAENNLSETAFFVPTGDRFSLRWFTPLAEVDLCGHATLAAAHVLFEHLGYDKPAITFETRSGRLGVERKNNQLQMNFPAIKALPCAVPALLQQAIGLPIEALLVADDYLVVLDSEADLRRLQPDQNLLSQLDKRGIIVTARSEEHDFVSRFFAPKLGIPEDPVTGSAHCTLAPYWAEKLNKTRLRARQLSQRGGDIDCEIVVDRVILAGSAVTFMTGEISLDI